MEVDARGFACPVPRLRAERALAALPPDGELVVLADDPEAAIDLAALAEDAGRPFTREAAGRFRFGGAAAAG